MAVCVHCIYIFQKFHPYAEKSLIFSNTNRVADTVVHGIHFKLIVLLPIIWQIIDGREL